MYNKANLNLFLSIFFLKLELCVFSVSVYDCLAMGSACTGGGQQRYVEEDILVQRAEGEKLGFGLR